MLVDITPPIRGMVSDGKRNERELKFSSETVSKYANWEGFSDPESGIAEYKIDVYINNEMLKTFDNSKKTEFEDHTISMEHNDEVYFKVYGINGAENQIGTESDGFRVDQTPPVMTFISDNSQGLMYQSDNTQLQLEWEFYDSESGIDEYRTIIFETRYGVKQKYWPTNERNNITSPISPYSAKIQTSIKGLSLQDGVTYSLQVNALNGARLATAHETKGVTIDTTRPDAPTVRYFCF